MSPFGKNRIQSRTFDWQYLSSSNFDLYYYDGRRKVATEAIKFLESEFNRISDLIGYSQIQKTKVFLYSSINHLRQSNMGIDSDNTVVGGVTSFKKPYVEIAHPGSLYEFKEELLLRVSNLIINEMMFGGSLKDIVRSSALLKLPTWVIDGASLYIAKQWDSEMDDYTRQFVQSNPSHNAVKSTGIEAAIIGQSIWNYVVVTYGKSIMGNILNYIRVIRNEQRSVSTTLGIRFQQFINDWRNFYLAGAEKVNTNFTPPEDTTRFHTPHKKNSFFTSVKISPDGEKIAFATNYGGKYRVIVKSLLNGKETVVLNGGTREYGKIINNRVPLLSWGSTNTLGVIADKNNEFIFWLYNLKTKTKSHRVFSKINNIRSFDISSTGRLGVMSADMEGQSDLFLFSTNLNKTRRLTNDIFDDFDPTFIPETNSFVFSSNRTTDTTNTHKGGIVDITKNYSLFSYNLDTTTNIVNRLTNSFGMDSQPYVVNQNTIFYLSDKRGVVNLFKLNTQNGVHTQVTNFPSGILDFDINPVTRTLAVITLKDLRQDIFFIKNFDFERQIFSPATYRKEYLQFKALTDRKRKQDTEKPISVKQLIEKKLKTSSDTINLTKLPTTPNTNTSNIKSDSIINTEDYYISEGNQTAEEIDSVNKTNSLPPNIKSDSIIDTEDYDISQDSQKSSNTESYNDASSLDVDDYKFSDEALVSKKTNDSYLNKFLNIKEKNRITGPKKYFSEFSYDNLGTDFVIDPLQGSSLRLKTQMKDILGNYKFHLGFQSAFDFKNGRVFAEFEYLKRRMDYSIRFDRKVLFMTQNERFQKYSFQKLGVGFSLPINIRTRIAFKPFLGYTRYLDLGQTQISSPGPGTFEPASQQYYGGINAEIVYDNSIVTNLNAIEGTKGKMGISIYNGLGNKNAGFSQFYLDFRHYQKIYKEIVLAIRTFAGTYLGNAPKKYALGGMDNWIGNTTNYEGLGNPLRTKSGFNQNIIFTEFITTLRGFDYATIFGSSVALANVEFRLPLIRALSSGPIASNFFRNIQFSLFYDIGSSWTGPPPINAQNNLSVEQVKQGPFDAKIKQYLNPWLYSYGLGFRTMILGYYLKFDFAWPVENFKVKSTRLMVTLGFDF